MDNFIYLQKDDRQELPSRFRKPLNFPAYNLAPFGYTPTGA
jgi:hypothetical protein